MPRLAYLSLETPRPGQASQTHIDEIIAGLRAAGWEVALFAARRGGASSGGGIAARLRDYLAVQWALARRLRGFDAVYVRAHFMAAPLAWWAAWRGVPVVHEINGKPADLGVTYRWLRRFTPLLAWLYRTQFRRAAQLLPVTPGLADWARGFAGHGRVTVVSNAANTRLFTPEGPRGAVAGRYAIFVGGLVAWHGIGAMLAALDDAAWPADVRLVVVGDGAERARLQAAAGHPRLLWLGRVPYPEVPALLRGALAALCVIEDPDGRSASGVAPLKLFEAMACGVPVVVSDMPCQAELVRAAGAGLVVPPAVPAALAAAIGRLAAAPGEAAAMGARGAAHARAEASWEQRARQVDALLRSALVAGTPPAG